MKKLLAVIDMQNDFIDGSLGSSSALPIVERIAEKIKKFDGEVVFTLDTHSPDYLNSSEGKKLPIEHCIKPQKGWELNATLKPLSKHCKIFEKLTFGSTELAEYISHSSFDEVELVGLCTDICVISNALLIKTFTPETSISVDSACCAGTSAENHENALSAMRCCQIDIK